MENELVKDWKGLSLIKGEDEVIDIELDEEKDVKLQVSWCLVGKLNIKNSFNPEAL